MWLYSIKHILLQLIRKLGVGFKSFLIQYHTHSEGTLYNSEFKNFKQQKYKS